MSRHGPNPVWLIVFYLVVFGVLVADVAPGFTGMMWAMAVVLAYFVARAD